MHIHTRHRAMIFMLVAMALGSPALARPQRCDLSPSPTGRQVPRRVAPDDLLKLRDFGSPGTGNAPSPFTLSADGRKLALALRQADETTDSYCTAIVVVPTDRADEAAIIDDAGEIVPATFSRYGMIGLPLGIPKAPLLSWSPTGHLLAYTKELPDHSEIWVHDLAAHVSSRVVPHATDISALAWSRDGLSLLFASRPDIPAAQAQLEVEGRSGFRFDGRFWPLASDHPMLPSSIAVRDQAVVLASRETRAWTADDGLALHPAASWPKRALALARSGDGKRTAWAAAPVDEFGGKARLMVRDRGRQIACSWASCIGVSALWWADDQGDLVFQRRSGVADSETEFYVWRPGTGAPHRFTTTRDALFGCQAAGTGLYCAEEKSTSPRRIIFLSPKDGHREILYEPNAAFGALTLGSVRRLEWSNALGIPTFGDLVLPPASTPGVRLPLVIVQYDSRGFLRGGTGDEYPIQALATRGFAVLSFNRPNWYGFVHHAVNEAEFHRLNMTGWADRQSNLSSLETIIRQLDSEGIIDPKRVAITGQSDGAVTATFALANSSLFSAAILSTCCEGSSMLDLGGNGYDDFYIGMGYPATRAAQGDFWKRGSLAEAPAAHPVPILIQASSDEFRMGLSTYRELHRSGWPIDLFVYPDEGHVKLHPAHRAAIYRRNIEFLSAHLLPGH